MILCPTLKSCWYWSERQTIPQIVVDRQVIIKVHPGTHSCGIGTTLFDHSLISISAVDPLNPPIFNCNYSSFIDFMLNPQSQYPNDTQRNITLDSLTINGSYLMASNLISVIGMKTMKCNFVMNNVLVSGFTGQPMNYQASTGVYTKDFNVTMINTTISQVSGSQGAVLLDTPKRVLIDGCQFINNPGSFSASAISIQGSQYWYESNLAHIRINNSTFNGNSHGSVMKISRFQNLDVINCTFKDNDNLNVVWTESGAYLVFNDTIITNNRLNGSVIISTRGYHSLNRCNLTNNLVSSDGVINLKKALLVELNLKETRFLNNTYYLRDNEQVLGLDINFNSGFKINGGYFQDIREPLLSGFPEYIYDVDNTNVTYHNDPSDCPWDQQSLYRGEQLGWQCVKIWFNSVKYHESSSDDQWYDDDSDYGYHSTMKRAILIGTIGSVLVGVTFIASCGVLIREMKKKVELKQD
ncbi:hypothetical protein SAMD00019534_029610 [Acytostelium subglobosum LB1]|uniref:hypothetical protein n=1 Tax=Acytostelium subglobosum LB1 TaxID=1410327 RepID=UPI000644F1E4|nr:hypothetical protein SAMD00019534_029610 [Acytostelium subglobosum LB1]GAM19786.1 hypothetical protein SAMD00019534_029610 [Acytostelium subglobosum LB1]|eukprot:XP_012756548.1 hypothetical protein SAMD00019534_029610 [Acytostelium subglobosum LB1]